VLEDDHEPTLAGDPCELDHEGQALGGLDVV
jgi:hypothetical protein